MKVLIEASSIDAVKSVTSDAEIEACYIQADEEAARIESAVDAELIARLEKDYAFDQLEAEN